jgi:hypothetical protein
MGHIVWVFSVGIRSVFLGIYHTDTQGKLGQYFWYQNFGGSPSKHLREPPFSLEGGASAFFLKRGGLSTRFVHFTLLFEEKRNYRGIFQKKNSRENLKMCSRQSLQHNNTDRNTENPANLIPAKYRYQKNCW